MFANFDDLKRGLTLEEAFVKYVDMCELDKLSPYTIKNKKITFRDFMECIEGKNIIYCRQLKNTHLNDFKVFLSKERKNMTSTINENYVV